MTLIEEHELPSLYYEDSENLHLRFEDIEAITNLMKSRIPEKRRISW